MTEKQKELVRLHMRDTYDVAPWEWDSGELELAIYDLITKKEHEVLEFSIKRNELLSALSDSIYEEFQTYAYLPDLIQHIKSFNCG